MGTPRRPPLTPAQRAEVVRLHDGGLSYAVVAALLGLNCSVVAHAGRRAGARVRRTRAWSITARDDYTDEQGAFLRAVMALKKVRPCPTWADVLRAAVAAGYRRTEAASEEYKHLYTSAPQSAGGTEKGGE